MKSFLGCLSGLFLYIVCLVISLVFMCVIAAWLCNIDPEKTYSWYSGVWQGLFCIPNWIRSFIYNGVLCKAIHFTPGYNFCWWIMLIISILGILGIRGKG